MRKWMELEGPLPFEDEESIANRKIKYSTTKPCPKCGIRIEKIDGCSHMTCKQFSCQYEFCWECGGEFHTTGECTKLKDTRVH